jgi:hypothetical protein
MRLELKIESVEEFLTILKAVRGSAVPLAEEDLEEVITEMASERLDDLVRVSDSIRDEVRQMRDEATIQRGALEETITQVRGLQKMAMHTGPWTVEPKKNGKTAMIRGIYCRFCGKELDTKKAQKIFCSQGCAGRWQGQHKGEHPTPRLTLKDEMLGTTVVAGEGVRD